MNVKLISYTKCTAAYEDEYAIENMQDLVAFCARVSNPANQHNKETSDKLIKYLIKNSHWSPLEMVSLCLEIETTRDIGRQILRHRSFTFQEFSQRYADVNSFGAKFVLREARLQDVNNRQNSIDTTDEMLQLQWNLRQTQVLNAAEEAYTWALQNGIAKEVARCVLPEGNTKTRIFMNGTLRSWVHYILLRREFGTQKEHMKIAKLCSDVITEVFPLIEDIG